MVATELGVNTLEGGVTVSLWLLDTVGIEISASCPSFAFACPVRLWLPIGLDEGILNIPKTLKSNPASIFHLIQRIFNHHRSVEEENG